MSIVSHLEWWKLTVCANIQVQESSWETIYWKCFFIDVCEQYHWKVDYEDIVNQCMNVTFIYLYSYTYYTFHTYIYIWFFKWVPHDGIFSIFFNLCCGEVGWSATFRYDMPCWLGKSWHAFLTNALNRKSIIGLTYWHYMATAITSVSQMRARITDEFYNQIRWKHNFALIYTELKFQHTPI